jgi:hypothetical protein
VQHQQADEVNGIVVRLIVKCAFDLLNVVSQCRIVTLLVGCCEQIFQRSASKKRMIKQIGA